ncbi:OmpA family protein [Aureispira anguillae]|uniref:OmpA family protein n=1 Tax=Aureispira anguillae TaxID=2864201 RepID=A0A915YC34_9BACT|nr:OmpA family protein [Aureispira anguillae]BDS10321.1 OmpA family protein [Aureispira anguillae]
MQRRNSLYALITATGLAAWIATGSYLFSENCCDTSIDSYDGTIGGTMLIEDGNTFRLQTKKTIIFPKNSAKPILYEEVSKNLIEIVRYIKSNPIKKVTIMGLFLEDESGGAKLGRERADSIRQLFINAGTPEYQIEIEAGQRNDLTQDVKNEAVFGAIDFIFHCIAPFEVNDISSSFKMEVANNLVFNYSSSSLLLELPADIKQALIDLATYLNDQPSRKLILTGYNHPDELNKTTLVNLGLARANYVRNLLVNLGADGQQIEIKGIADERLAVFESDLYQQFLPNAMGFEFDVLPIRSKKSLSRKISKIESDFKEMQVFRFKDFGEDKHKIIINDKLKTYMNDLILYLSINKKAKIYCVGHSNKLATKESSALKGTERAQYVRDFLINHGILAERIEITTAADSHPLGEETTKYGQQINRRVDLFISYDGTKPRLYALPPISAEQKKLTTKKKVQQDSPKVSSTIDSNKRGEIPSIREEKNDSL